MNLPKNPSARLHLDQIRLHPWVIHGMSPKELEEWSHNPYQSVDISKNEIDGALTLFVNLFDSLKVILIK